MANGEFGGGDGTKESPFLVEDAEDLDAVRDDLEACYKQTNDINLEEYDNWTMIGDGFEKIFLGDYDGDNYEIRNLKIKSKKDQQGIGLFGIIMTSKLENIHLKDVDVQGGTYVGALVGYSEAESEVIGCSVDGGEVKGQSSVGGLVGAYQYGEIEESNSNVSVKSEKRNDHDESAMVGGIGGTLTGSDLKNCYSLSDVEGLAFIGGLAGNSVGSIENCYFKGSITGVTSLGGLVADSADSIKNSFSLINEINYISDEDLDEDDFELELFGDIIIHDDDDTELENNYSFEDIKIIER